jgi:dephospho-CoA kinase
VIAITGGIATGKSTFTRLFKVLLPAETFDTDACAHRLLEEDADVRREIRQIFGEAVLDAQGRIDRAALRQIVFASAERRRELEAILHPRIRASWQGWTQDRLQNDPNVILLVEIPLLYETGAATLFDKVIAVGCALETQLRRLTQERKLSPDHSRRMAASQLDLAEKIRQSDYLIWNAGPQESLRAQAALCARHCQSFYHRPIIGPAS